MKILLKMTVGLLLIVGLLVVLIWLRPVEASRVIWPWVEALNLDPFVGITTNGVVQADLFAIEPTGISTAPIVGAAQRLLEALDPEQRERVQFAVDDDEWRRWANIHISTRQGVGFGEMTAEQQEAVWALVASGMSAKGLQLAQDVTRLEEHLAELMNDHYQYGEHRYWITVMGTPSATQPWGWQFEGHHLIINCFVLGDQIVMTPSFFGAEPVRADTGKYAGTEILQSEQRLALTLMKVLNQSQRSQAIVQIDKPGNNNYGELFQDNAIVPIEGLPLRELTGSAKVLAERLIRLYVDNMRPGHAEQRMAEVRQHWDETHFAWVGGFEEDSVFYYRIHSPVLMIEFDHQQPVALAGPDQPTRTHIHTVIRTPNGNDYGKDLLAQHLARHSH